MKIKAPVLGPDKHFYCALGNILKIGPFPLDTVGGGYHPQGCTVLIINDKAIGSGSEGFKFRVRKNQKKCIKNQHKYE
jgi:hypothetical protein